MTELIYLSHYATFSDTIAESHTLIVHEEGGKILAFSRALCTSSWVPTDQLNSCKLKLMYFA